MSKEWEAVIVSADEYKFKRPEPSGWKCTLVDGLVLLPQKGKVPNRFWRLMQRLFFGFRWELQTPAKSLSK
jgi:hypothetical protein